ncbi:MAG: uroporphyrinogen decarboxylase family protein [Spirochaetota bacterium]
MTHKERFIATVERRPVDRPASWLGLPVAGALPALYRQFGVKDIIGLKSAINDDVWPVEVPYDDPPADHIACAFNFAVDTAAYEERTLTARGFFADRTDVRDVAKFTWPDPAEHMSTAACKAALADVPPGYAVMGILWSAHFQDTCAAFGMENALMTMLTEPRMFKAVDDRVTEFYLTANKIFFEATIGRLDAVLIGNDLGSQTGLMLSPEMIREHVLPNAKRLIAQAKSYGVKVVYHSCGSICPVIDDLIKAGVDVIHPIQALAAGMSPGGLKDSYGTRTAFCGGVDAQELLVRGTPDAVTAKVRELKAIFPTGLVISPSHEAILPDIAPANIEALFNEAEKHSPPPPAPPPLSQRSERGGGEEKNRSEDRK